MPNETSVKNKYAVLRSDVHQIMLINISPFITGPLTNLTDIDEQALQCWENQWRPFMQKNNPWSDCNWRSIIKDKRNWLHRFEVAVWSDQQLCGLAIGNPSKGRSYLSIHVLQGSPLICHPLKGKIISIVIDTACAYGKALDCRELRIIRPLSGVTPIYERFGFRLAIGEGSCPYCVVEL